MQVHRGRGEREADGAVGGGWLTQVGHHPAIIESGPRNHLRATHGKHASVRSCTFASARRMGNCRVAVGGTAGAGSPCPHPRGPSSAGPPSLHRKHGKVCALGRPPLAAFSPIVTSELRFACHNFLINAPPHPLLPTPLAVRLRAPTASFCKWGETDIRMSKSEMNMKMLLLVQNFTESKLVSQFVRGRLCHQESGVASLPSRMSIVERLSRSLGGNVTDTGIYTISCRHAGKTEWRQARSTRTTRH
jgi:hypothetical protein